MERSTLLWCILGRDIAGDTSLDPLRSSGDAGSVWIDASVEDEGPPAARLASTARGTPITTQDDVAPSASLPTADRRTAVQEIHQGTTGGRSAPLVRPGSAHRARLRSGRGALVNC